MADEQQITESSIYDLVINSKKFEQLEVEINKFNPFKVLDIAHYEIRHSNVLAWLINPQKNHNLGDKVLKKIILQVLHNPENEDIIPNEIRIKDVQNGDFVDAEIYREWKNIDLLTISESNKFILLVENKIKSGESSGQLEKYLKTCRERFSNKYKILPVFLTLGGINPSSDKYCILDYGTVYDIVQFVSNLYYERMSKEVNNFIKYYLNTLGGLLAMDDKIKQLCLDIYKDHKEIINKIYDVGHQIDIEQPINEFKKEYPSILETFRNNKSFWFSIPEFHNIPKMEHDWGGGYPISFWFAEYYGKMKLVLEIGPFDDASERVRFLNHLYEKGVHISDRAKEYGRKYSRLCTDTKNIKDWSDKNEIVDAMISLFNQKKMIETKNRLLKALETFQWFGRLFNGYEKSRT